MSIFLGKPSAKICDTLEKRYPKAPFTVNGTNYNTFKDALDAVNASTVATNTLILNKNVYLDEIETVVGENTKILPFISKNVTIDLNGKLLKTDTIQSTDGNRFLKVGSSTVNVTIKNGKIEVGALNGANGYTGLIRTSGYLNIQNVDYKCLGNANNKYFTILAENGGTIDISDSEMYCLGVGGCVGAFDGSLVNIHHTNVTSKYISGMKDQYITAAVGAEGNEDDLTAEPGKIVADNGCNFKAINSFAIVGTASSGGLFEFTDCNFEYQKDQDETAVTGNKYGAGVSLDELVVNNIPSKHHCTFTNCTVNHPSASDDSNKLLHIHTNNDKTFDFSGVKITIDGTSYEKFNVGYPTGATVLIKSGTFDIQIPVANIEPGKVCIQDPVTGKWVVQVKPPIHIKSVADLQQLQAEVAAGDDKATETYIQDVDLDLTGIAWTGIGTTTTPFAGVYDGNNKKITGITFNIGKYRGLFTVICGATIKNIDITTAGNGFVSDITGEVGGAILVGLSIGSTAINKGSTIENCTVAGNFGSETNPCTHNAAGILGMHDHRNYKTDVKTTTKISNCKVNANIYGDYTKLGGIIAFSLEINYTINGDIEVLSCSVNGILKHVDPNNRNKLGSAEGGFGGIIGWTVGSHTCTTINDCSVICDFSSDKSNMQITKAQCGVGTIGGFIGGPAKSLSSINYVITDQFAHRIGSNSGMLNTEFGIVSPDGSYVTLPKYSDISSINGHATYKLMSYNDTATAALGISVLTEDSYIDIDESLIDASRRGKIHKITHNNVELTGQLVTGTAATYRYKA